MDVEQGLSNTATAPKNQQTASPESSQDSTPQKDYTLSEKTFAMARKLFSADQDRSNLQVLYLLYV